MDLERIKQNFRLRSGRTKKTRKPAGPVPPGPQQANPQRPNGHVGAPPVSNPPTPTKEKERIYHPSLDRTAPPTPTTIEPLSPTKGDIQNRPELPHASTQLNGAAIASIAPPQPDWRYGRSGMDKPRRRSPPAPLKHAMSEPKLPLEESDAKDFDLKPPPRKPKPPSLEGLADLLFSEGHLNAILHDPQMLLRLTTFLHRYKSHLCPLLIKYLETRKAIKAIEYANAVAQTVFSMDAEDAATDHSQEPRLAARLDPTFARESSTAFGTLLADALPAYLTYTLVKIVTECLTNEITGRSTPIMRDLVGGLSEIFCLTDPNQDDNPIIYASEEFYRFTGYDTEDVIGSNCRFLQGPKTRRDGPQRLREGQDENKPVCETLLNYRRDGRAFLNLLMTAPLFDDKGKLKYFIGAQVDVSRLVENGKGLDSFQTYLKDHEKRQRGRSRRIETGLDASKEKALEKLRDLSEMFDLEESTVVRSHSRSSSLLRDDESMQSRDRPRTARRVIPEPSKSSDDEAASSLDDGEKSAWTLANSGPSGNLPGVYQSYLLIRPTPSLRIIFVSPELRKYGNMMQSPFLAHVAAPASTLAGLKESFQSGAPVTAKIGWMANAGVKRDGTRIDRINKDHVGATTTWISATPLLGGDEEVGVWMVVFIRDGKVNPSRQVRNTVSRSNVSLSGGPSEPKGARPEPENGGSVAHSPSPGHATEGNVALNPRRRDNPDFTTTRSPPPHSSPRTPLSPPARPLTEHKRSAYGVALRSNEALSAWAREIETPEQRNGHGSLDGDNEINQDHDDEDVFVHQRARRRSSEKSASVQLHPDGDDEATLPQATEATLPQAMKTTLPQVTEATLPRATEATLPQATEVNDDMHVGNREDHDEDAQPAPDEATVKNPSPHSERASHPLQPDRDEDSSFKTTRDSSPNDPNATPPDPANVDRTPVSTRPSSPEGEGAESILTKPNSTLYMDYLRHPSINGQVTGVQPMNGDGDWEDDSDCARSPYSVD